MEKSCSFNLSEDLEELLKTMLSNSIIAKNYQMRSTKFNICNFVEFLLTQDISGYF